MQLQVVQDDGRCGGGKTGACRRPRLPLTQQALLFAKSTSFRLVVGK